MRNDSKWLAALSAIAAMAMAGGSPVAAQDRQLTPTEKAAGERADAALKAKDYVLLRSILAGPELANVAQARTIMAQLHAQGLGGPKDDAAARAEQRRAAELGDLRTMTGLAESLEREGTPASRAEAKSWYTTASNKGMTHASAHLGRMLFLEGDKAGAFAQWQRGAVSDPFARACLGMAYAAGEGTRADPLMASYQFWQLVGTGPSEGNPCIQAAADAGNPWAQTAWGEMLTKEGSRILNVPEGVKYLAAASEQRNVRAAERLAEILDKGQGVPRDPAGAFTQYLRAANGGEERYFARLGDMALKGDGVPRSVSEAVMFYSKDEFGEHMYQLGLIYAGAEGWPRDMAKAVDAMTKVYGDKQEALAKAWLKAQADAGNADAQYAYASDIEYERVEKDAAGRELTYEQQQAAEGKLRSAAYDYYRKAARQGHVRALVKLGTSGSAGGTDAQRLQMLKAAADKGSGSAMLEIARSYALGWLGLPKDPAQDAAWKARAAQTRDKNTLASLGEMALVKGALGTNYMGSDPAKIREVANDYLASARYYEMAHNLGYENAAGQLADIYDDSGRLPGVGNPALEYKWRRIAAQTNQSDEREALSKLYESGRGTAVDLPKAWYLTKRNSDSVGKANDRADALWQRMTPLQRQTAERYMIECKLSGYKNCAV